MIVTADPVGDFNATSQILRYSALAREVTVPRIPSVSSTILAGLATNCNETSQERPRSHSSQTTPVTGADSEMVDLAFAEIARLNEEVEILNVRLAEAEGRRSEAEENWQRAEDRAEGIEMEVREECWGEMEEKLSEERRRWGAAWGEEADRNDEHLDRKIELLSQGMQIHEDEADAGDYKLRLEAENETLRRRMENLEREMQCASPTKAKKFGGREVSFGVNECEGGVGDEESVLRSSVFGLNRLHLGGELDGNGDGKVLGGGELDVTESGIFGDGEVPETPEKVRKVPGSGKKIRKLTARKWDLMDENELVEYGV